MVTQATYTPLFGQRLVERGIISEKQLEEALHKQKTSMTRRRLGEVLVRLGYISKSHITDGLADQLGIPVVNLREREISDRLRTIIDVGVAQLYRVVPVGEENGKLLVATADPTNINQLDNLEKLLDRPIQPCLATPEDISQALSRYYGLNESTVETMLSTVSTQSTLSTMSNMSAGGEAMSNVGSLSGDSLASISVDNVEFEAEGGEGDEEDADSPVVRYVHNLIYEAFRLRASDIHVEPGKTDLKVRYRIDGVLHRMPPPPKRAQPSVISRLKLMAGMDIAERRVPQDGRIKLTLAGKVVDLRVSALPAIHGESMVMRILDKSGLLLGVGQLGFMPEVQKTWEQILYTCTGVVLETGPTGSGKTTTLYASLHQLNSPSRKIITVEDPIEYQLPGINQVPVHHEIGMDFARALRAIFRQDPDIVMVGEIRDLETAEIAIRAALTGHLVFSTLHTNDSASAFMRLVDIGLKPFLVAAGVRTVLAQRLVRTICPHCKEVYTPTDIELERLGYPLDLDKVDLFHGAGCEVCNQTGFHGRLGVYELLVTSDTVRDMIMNNASSNQVRQQARKEGMSTLREDGIKKVLNGTTTISEVLRVTPPDAPMKETKPDAEEVVASSQE
ncbi:MAG: ATPase, T2SS/T4P/T4SS family [Candidatus Hydrogenedentota bacterium]